MKNLYVSGYRSYEISVFANDDPKIFYIKQYLKRRLIEYIESGLEWIIISGQLGTEIWAGEVVLDLKEDYPEIQLGVLLPYTGFAENWNETNRSVFDQLLDKADYMNYTSSSEYKHPGQLKGNQEFILKHTDATLLFYDREFEGKPKYLYDMIIEYQEFAKYDLEMIALDELQQFVTDYDEVYREERQ